MGSEVSEKESVITQISVGGFGYQVTAKELSEFLEKEIGVVYRCRLKTSWTPPDSYPDFEIMSMENIRISDNYKKVEPHAFVHFALPESAAWAHDIASRGYLLFGNQPLKVSLGPQNPFRINKMRQSVFPFRLSNVVLEIGTLISPDEFFISWRGPSSGLDFFVDPFDGTCKFCFTRDTVFSFKDTTNRAIMKCDYKVEFLVREINEIKQYREFSCLVVLLRLASSPRVWYRTADDDIEESVPFDLLDDDDPWIRTVDFTPNGAIGRCNWYRLLIPPRNGPKLEKAIKYLKERRVLEDFLRRPVRSHEEPDFGVPKKDVFFSINHMDGIDFDVMFLLNAAVHKNIFSQHRLPEKFFNLLKKQPKELNVAALKHICTYKHPVFDAYKRVRIVQEWLLKNPKLYQSPRKLDDIVEIRRLVITPTKAYCLPPEVELSNRVLRRYKDVADRFLRVAFMEEGMQIMNANILSYYVASIVKEITSTSFSQKTLVFKRLKNIMTYGFRLCGRKYSFLAFSSNQLRDRSAWFFAADGKTDVKEIKKWMGKFNNRNVAKCAARMGQCFSSTYATVDVPPHKVNPDLPDVERNGYLFSDGIGKITPDLAKQVAEKLKLETYQPSAYQIRYAGYKGVVACWPGNDAPGNDDGICLLLRNSMNKFQSKHTTLEICSWTRFQPGFLNRQIITLLSTLKVPDEIFWNMQQNMIRKLNQMLVDPDVAFEVLMASCAEHGNTAALMLTAGFRPQTEPHLRGMLSCIRAAQLWGLREKARIFVPSGRWLMGCFDELGVLEQGQCFIQVSTPALENCFLKHGSRFSETKKNLEVITGYVIIAKNPCLHPGDIRILEAVDAPGLSHMYDCLVFPQKGERPHANEASGSDLDGDLYFVTWDENLIPPSKKSWAPMDYSPAEPKLSPQEVTHQDIINFFVQHILNENLGAICNAHVVHADISDKGALDEKCTLLAELAATAVDFPKTGKIVKMPHHLKPKLYPDFMQKEPYISYRSVKILGRLYRQIKDAYDVDINESCDKSFVAGDIPYDPDLEVAGAANFVDEAWDCKCSYDGQLSGLLGQYKVTREEEVVTGHVWSMPKYTSNKQGDLIERLKQSYTALRKEFRQIFEKMDVGLADEEKNLLYEQKASAWYQVAYHPEWVKKSLDLQDPDGGGSGTSVMLSFAWIATDYLARIKIKKRAPENIDGKMPINSLARYIADRI